MAETIVTPPEHHNLELDHLYARDLTHDYSHDIERVGQRLYKAYVFCSSMVPPGDTSATVHMLDNYNLETDPRKRVLPPVGALERIVKGAQEYDVPLDYIALEGGFAPLAKELLEQRIKPHATIADDDRHKSAWLYRNMGGPKNDSWYSYHPPDHESPIEELTAVNNTAWIELFSYKRNRRGNVRRTPDGEPMIDKWACPYLAAMFLASRLGGLRHDSLTPQLVDPDNLPDYEDWTHYPTIMQLNPDAGPFIADEAFSVLPRDFQAAEHGSSIIAHLIDETINDRYSLASSEQLSRKLIR